MSISEKKTFFQALINVARLVTNMNKEGQLSAHENSELVERSAEERR